MYMLVHFSWMFMLHEQTEIMNRASIFWTSLQRRRGGTREGPIINSIFSAKPLIYGRTAQQQHRRWVNLAGKPGPLQFNWLQNVTTSILNRASAC